MANPKIHRSSELHWWETFFQLLRPTHVVCRGTSLCRECQDCDWKISIWEIFPSAHPLPQHVIALDVQRLIQKCHFDLGIDPPVFVDFSTPWQGSKRTIPTYWKILCPSWAKSKWWAHSHAQVQPCFLISARTARACALMRRICFTSKGPSYELLKN